MRVITLHNYRCFGDEPQSARLAPLTLLVGENSSGKTSVMAMLRALWDIAYNDLVPDFKREPYDLGSFEEIAHHRGARGGRAEQFEAGFEFVRPTRGRNGSPSLPIKMSVKFESQWSAPVPVSRRFDRGDYWIDQDLRGDQLGNFEFGTPNGSWKYRDQRMSRDPILRVTFDRIQPVHTLLFGLEYHFRQETNKSRDITPIDASPDCTADDVASLSSELFRHISRMPARRDVYSSRLFASAPVRSQPQRVYSYDLAVADSSGDYTPSFLAQLALRDPEAWRKIKKELEKFGKSAGLFDEVRVRHLGKTDADPFQIQVRKFSNSAKGPFRNLVDVGYGISQVLPVVTEMLKANGPNTLLLQQPEVHLHPSAQAAIGTLLCDIAAGSGKRQHKQVVVETHSDFIVDRVRMAVADTAHQLRPEDVALVYFERRGLDVKLHSIAIDALGNIAGAPRYYRKFFLDELQRSIGV